MNSAARTTAAEGSAATRTREASIPMDDSKQLYRVTEAMRMLSLSRSVIYEQLRSRRLRSVKQGRTRLVPASAIADYVALLEREAHGAGIGVAS
jgi:excisionase family DNA binding protein